MRRTLFWSGLLWLSFSAVLVAGQSATGVKPNRPEKLLGSWKQLPPDQPSTLKIEVEAGGIKMSEGCKEDGFCTSSIVGKYDGKLSKYPDDARWEASFRKMGDGTAQQDTYFHGKLDNTDKWQTSPDRNTLTVTNQVVSHPGSKAMRYVYDRSGGPVSKDDPFIGFWKRNWDKSDLLISTYTSNGDVFTVTGPDGVTSERNCDGKDHPNAADTTILYSCHFTDPHTDEVAFKKNGKLLMTRTNKISEDGKNMVSTLRDRKSTRLNS